MIEHGEADGFFTTYRLPEREAWADYCREELASAGGFAVRPEGRLGVVFR